MSHEELRDAVTSYWRGSDSRDLDLMTSVITDDFELKFGNSPATKGKDAFVSAATEFFGAIKSVRHDVVRLWVVDDGAAVIGQADVHYEKLDGEKVVLPCANVFDMRDGQIAKCQIFMDIGPVFT